jgi:dTDP-4-amino-4,6-dideoxygalactose transaminase
MSAILCEINEGDEVILPSYTFVSTANAFHLRGAKLVFADIRNDTLNINENLIEDLITDKTKAIVPVHYAGVACEMDSIMGLAKKYGLQVIEDAAQGVYAKYKGQYLGTIGDIGTYSFHETKNFNCGEGGAITLNGDQYYERAEIIREKGTNRSQFLRGSADKYTWVDKGSSYLPSDLLAAFLYAQLEHMKVITRKRKEIYELYYELLKPLSKAGHIVLPTIPSSCETNYHMFHILLQNNEIRMALIGFLLENQIQSVFHYVPLHSSPMGLALGNKNGDLPVTENISERVLRLPFYYELTLESIVHICGKINEFFVRTA